MALLSAAEFMARFKRDQEMLARGECPEGYLLCTGGCGPTNEDHLDTVGRCRECQEDAYYTALGDIVEQHPIIPPGIRRRGF